jgi:hypothetical protein
MSEISGCIHNFADSAMMFWETDSYYVLSHY